MRVGVGPALLIALAAAGTAAADGGRICVSEVVGPLRITVFDSPTPLRVGMADVTVLVQDALAGGSEPQASVWLSVGTAGSADAPMQIEAVRGASANRLLYAAPLCLASAGVIAIEARVRTATAEAHVRCTAEVVGAEPVLLAYWPLIALPPATILLYAAHQVLRHRQTGRRHVRSRRVGRSRDEQSQQDPSDAASQ